MGEGFFQEIQGSVRVAGDGFQAGAVVEVGFGDEFAGVGEVRGGFIGAVKGTPPADGRSLRTATLDSTEGIN